MAACFATVCCTWLQQTYETHTRTHSSKPHMHFQVPLTSALCSHCSTVSCLLRSTLPEGSAAVSSLRLELVFPPACKKKKTSFFHVSVFTFTPLRATFPLLFPIRSRIAIFNFPLLCTTHQTPPFLDNVF